jgi:hypothetical protein
MTGISQGMKEESLKSELIKLALLSLSTENTKEIRIAIPKIAIPLHELDTQIILEISSIE